MTTKKKYNITVERHNKDGSKTKVAYEDFAKINRVKAEMLVAKAIDNLVLADPCNEAKDIITNIKQKGKDKPSEGE